MRFLSSKVHTIIGLVVGVVLLHASHIFGFSDNRTAAAVSFCVGIVTILSELVTTSKASPLKLIPMRIHLVSDYLVGIFLALSPWLFGFAGTSANVWMPHLIVGILIVGYALITNPVIDSKESVVK